MVNGLGAAFLLVRTFIKFGLVVRRGISYENIHDFISSLLGFTREYGSLIWICIGVLTIPFGGYALFGKKALQKIVDFWRTDIRELKKSNYALQDKLAHVRDAFDENNDLWMRVPTKPEGYHERIQQSIPIMVLANLKGGVGKTTIAANLAAYFETQKKERVLAIDLDYQGSLSSMLLPEPYNRQPRPAKAIRKLIEGTVNGDFAIAESRPIRKTTKDSRIIDCDDPFANFETQLVLRWLIGEIDGDIRYKLASVLHRPEIQKAFNRIIIDAPPRFTAGFIGALCASTHLVVPFVLDILSAERVGLFLGQLERMRAGLFPCLKLAGVVGTMKGDSTDTLRDAEKQAIREAKKRVSDIWGHDHYVLENALIPRKQGISDAAGLKIAYYELPDVFNPLGSALFERVPPKKPHPKATLRRSDSYEGRLAPEALR
jgi:cellulose biosynthesis protein BcsQ